MSRAAVWRGGPRVDLVDVRQPEPAAGDVVVAITTTTVCGSDRHTVSGRRGGSCPSILGHEGVGVVARIGPGPLPRRTDGTPLHVGDRVVWGVTVVCGDCDRCRAGRSAKCRWVRKVGHEPFDAAWPLSGTYATHILLPRGASVAPVPPDLPDVVAAPAGCATATVAAAIERAGDLEGARVTVLGAGMLGLTAAAMADHAGAASVTAVDPVPQRRTLARRFGATAAIESGDDLGPADIVLDFTGSAPLIEAAIASLDTGGRVVLVGSVAPGPAVAINPERLVRDWLTITGVHNYEPHHLQQAIEFLAETCDHYEWESLVAPARPLAELATLLAEPSETYPRRAIAP